jgi:hypothetical protein
VPVTRIRLQMGRTMIKAALIAAQGACEKRPDAYPAPMTAPPDPDTDPKAKASPPLSPREARLKAALRDNLRRRKAAAPVRETPSRDGPADT